MANRYACLVTDATIVPLPEPSARHLPVWSGYLAVGMLGILVGMFFFVLRGWACAGCTPPTDVVVPPVGIDAGPGIEEIDRALADAEVQAAAQLRAIEAAHQAEIAGFDAELRRKYEVVREMGPDAVATWLTGFNLSLRDGGLRDGGRQ